jgi:hypothetical protein
MLTRARGRTIPPLQVRDFCAAAYNQTLAAHELTWFASEVVE